MAQFVGEGGDHLGGIGYDFRDVGDGYCIALIFIINIFIVLDISSRINDKPGSANVTGIDVWLKCFAYRR